MEWVGLPFCRSTAFISIIYSLLELSNHDEMQIYQDQSRLKDLLVDCLHLDSARSATSALLSCAKKRQFLRGQKFCRRVLAWVHSLTVWRTGSRTPGQQSCGNAGHCLDPPFLPSPGWAWPPALPAWADEDVWNRWRCGQSGLGIPDVLCPALTLLHRLPSNSSSE